MALFYPATFGIVGQKMTTLQQRSQGDPEDPHGEHYLLATQSKQEQVCVCGFFFSHVFFISSFIQLFLIKALLSENK